MKCDSFRWLILVVAVSIYTALGASGEIIEGSDGNSFFEAPVHEDLKTAVFYIFRNLDSEVYWTIKAHWKGSGTPFQEWAIGPKKIAPAGGHDFDLLDMNFDGYQDVRILDWQGGTGNFGYSGWLFKPAVGRFEFHEGLSSLQGPRFDQEKREIHTLSKGGHAGAIYTRGIWTFIDDELVQLEEERQRFDDEDGHYVKVLRQRVDGELREVSRVKSQDDSGGLGKL